MGGAFGVLQEGPGHSYFSWHALRDVLRGEASARLLGGRGTGPTRSSAQTSPVLGEAARPKGLTRKETTQLHAGSAFFLQGTVLIAYQVISGGYFISEHPAPPMDESRASIWSSPWLTLLRSHPDVHLHVVPQWKFGATVPKPTGLLALRLPFFIRSLFRHADHSLVKPKAVAIGKDAEGNFRTSCHKEYPARFSAGLARADTDQLDQDLREGRVTSPSDCPAPLHSWIREAEEACSSIRRSACWLPDFQPESC